MSVPTVIAIDDQWRFRFASGNWILERHAITAKGNEVWGTVGYYSDLSAGCRRVLRDRLSELGVTGLDAYLAALDQAENLITAAVAKAFTGREAIRASRPKPQSPA